MQIFINRNNDRHGPYTLEQIQTYLASGQMQGSDLAWYEGIQGWVPLSQVPGVQLPQNQMAPPPPPHQAIPIQQPAKRKSPVLYGCGGCLTVIVGLAVIGALFGSNAPSSSTSSDSSSTAVKSSQSAPVQEAPDEKIISISAQQLDAEYEQNQVAADNNYKDKKVVVTGTVRDIGKDIVDDSYVTLAAGGLGVRCVFEKSEQSKLAQLSKGDTVTVHGICHGKTLGIHHCLCHSRVTICRFHIVSALIVRDVKGHLKLAKPRAQIGFRPSQIFGFEVSNI